MGYIGQSPQIAQSTYQSIDDISSSFNGSTTSFALQVGGVSPVPFPIASENCLISVGGVIQEPDGTGTNGFQLTGTNIVFSAAPASGQSFFGVILAGADYVSAGKAFPDGNAGTPSITFNQDLDTGLFRGGTGITSVSSNNNKIADFGPTAIVFNEDGDDVDFRVEGDTKANLFVVDAGNDKITLDGDLEPTTINGITFPTAGALGHRNLVINGSFQVAQRSTSRVFGDGYNALDRWATGQFQQAGHEYVSVSDSTVPTVTGIRVTSSPTSENASGTRMAVGQMIEAVNCVHLAGKKVTLSFYIRFSSATFTGYGNFTYGLNEFDTTANPDFSTTGATRTNNQTLTNGSLPTTWTKYTQTITCGSAMKNLAPRFLFLNLATTTNASDLWYEVAAVQVEEGEKATPFEHRNYGDELARCQRYFIAIHDPRLRGVFGNSNTVNRVALTLPTTMRTNPTYTTTGTYDVFDGDSTGTLTTFSASYTTADSVEFDGGTASGSFTLYRPAIFYVGTRTNQLNVDAEL